MNLLRLLIPCALQRSGDSVAECDERSCWSTADTGVRGHESRMTHRMGASTSSSITNVGGGDPVQAARLSSFGSPDQLGVVVR